MRNGGLGLETGWANAPEGHYGKDSVVEMTHRAWGKAGWGQEDKGASKEWRL